MTQVQTEEDASGQIQNDLSKNTDQQNSVGAATAGRSCPTVEHSDKPRKSKETSEYHRMTIFTIIAKCYKSKDPKKILKNQGMNFVGK